jgi:hypothetical protein
VAAKTVTLCLGSSAFAIAVTVPLMPHLSDAKRRTHHRLTQTARATPLQLRPQEPYKCDVGLPTRCALQQCLRAQVPDSQPLECAASSYCAAWSRSERVDARARVLQRHARHAGVRGAEVPEAHSMALRCGYEGRSGRSAVGGGEALHCMEAVGGVQRAQLSIALEDEQLLRILPSNGGEIT